MPRHMEDQEVKKGKYSFFLKHFNGMPITFRRNDENGIIEVLIDEYLAIEAGFYKLYATIQGLKQNQKDKTPVWVRVDDWKND